MKEIPVTRGKVTIIDDADFEWLSQWKWTWLNGYAGHYYREGNKVRVIGMHRIILGAKPEELCDHINGDKLDNRRQNLRLCNHSQNRRNACGRHSKQTRYKGVYPGGKKWMACIGYNYCKYYLGYFDTPEAAAEAYNKAATKFHGEFARLNIIETGCGNTSKSHLM